MRSAGSEGEEKMGANVEVLSESVRPTPKGSTSERLKRAVHRHRAVSRKGIQERLFTFAFSGLVYPQIWEDPLVDLEALDLKSGERVAAIASGGCNIMSYVTAADVGVTGLDLNGAHVALNRLKIAAARHLPDYATFARFFVDANSRNNVEAYKNTLAPHLDAETRRYWEGRDLLGRRRDRILQARHLSSRPARRFIGAGISWRGAPRQPASPRSRRGTSTSSTASSTRSSRRCSTSGWSAGSPEEDLRLCYGLGIPPAQYEALSARRGRRHGRRAATAAWSGSPATSDLADNYFAWQAFGRGYAASGSGPLPPYLRPQNFDDIRARAGHGSGADLLHRAPPERAPAESLDAYVLLDAQDWMTDAQLNALWCADHAHGAARRARHLPHGRPSRRSCPGASPTRSSAAGTYERERSRALGADRSSIYGGFHLYVLDR